MDRKICFLRNAYEKTELDYLQTLLREEQSLKVPFLLFLHMHFPPQSLLLPPESILLTSEFRIKYAFILCLLSLNVGLQYP